jgi:hypothetical protein
VEKGALLYAGLTQKGLLRAPAWDGLGARQRQKARRVIWESLTPQKGKEEQVLARGEAGPSMLPGPGFLPTYYLQLPHSIPASALEKLQLTADCVLSHIYLRLSPVPTVTTPLPGSPGQRTTLHPTVPRLIIQAPSSHHPSA